MHDSGTLLSISFSRDQFGSQVPSQVLFGLALGCLLGLSVGGSAETAGKIAQLLLIITYCIFLLNEASVGLLPLLFFAICHSIGYFRPLPSFPRFTCFVPAGPAGIGLHPTFTEFIAVPVADLCLIADALQPPPLVLWVPKATVRWDVLFCSFAEVDKHIVGSRDILCFECRDRGWTWHDLAAVKEAFHAWAVDICIHLPLQFTVEGEDRCGCRGDLIVQLSPPSWPLSYDGLCGLLPCYYCRHSVWRSASVVGGSAEL